MATAANRSLLTVLCGALLFQAVQCFSCIEEKTYYVLRIRFSSAILRLIQRQFVGWSTSRCVRSERQQRAQGDEATRSGSRCGADERLRWHLQTRDADVHHQGADRPTGRGADFRECSATNEEAKVFYRLLAGAVPSGRSSIWTSIRTNSNAFLCCRFIMANFVPISTRNWRRSTAQATIHAYKSSRK